MTYGSRVPNALHTSRPWRIHEVLPDFTLEDVWLLPAEGSVDDFPEALGLLTSMQPGESDSRAARFLWEARDLLGKWFGLGRISTSADEAGGRLPIPGTAETTLADRLPDDLRGTTTGLDLGRVPFDPLYRTDDEFAAEISNRTVHGVLHLAWADQGGGRYRAQMAVYVKPRGVLGRAYMAFIKPFRYAVVYPAMLRRIDRTWSER